MVTVRLLLVRQPAAHTRAPVQRRSPRASCTLFTRAALSVDRWARDRLVRAAGVECLAENTEEIIYEPEECTVCLMLCVVVDVERRDRSSGSRDWTAVRTLIRCDSISVPMDRSGRRGCQRNLRRRCSRKHRRIIPQSRRMLMTMALIPSGGNPPVAGRVGADCACRISRR